MDWIMDSKMNSSLMDICWRNRCKYILYIYVYIFIYIYIYYIFIYIYIYLSNIISYNIEYYRYVYNVDM